MNTLKQDLDSIVSHLNVDGKYGGFDEPNYKLNEIKQLELLEKVYEYYLSTNNDKLKIIVHHPYYRKIVRQYCKKLNLKYVVKTDQTIPHNDDSDMVKHNVCKLCIPLIAITWHDNEYTHCKNCNWSYCIDIPTIVYDEEKCDGNLGWMRVRGKNCVVISKI
jgi:hypothetical protein